MWRNVVANEVLLRDCGVCVCLLRSIVIRRVPRLGDEVALQTMLHCRADGAGYVVEAFSDLLLGVAV